MQNCPQCGHPNEDTARFCTQCGTGFVIDDSSHAPPPHTAAYASPPVVPPATGTNWPLVVAIAGVCVVTSTSIVAFALLRDPAPVATTPEAPTPTPTETTPTPTEAKSTPTPAPTAPAQPTQPDVTEVNAEVWKIVDPQGLNCRAGAGSNHEVVTVLRPGKEVLVDANYENPLVYDAKGDPWLAVVQPGVDCLVRANTAYLKPLPGKTQPEDRADSEGLCPSQSLIAAYFESENFDVFICSDAVTREPNFYVGSAKNGSGNITLPISRITAEGYFARNGDVVYHVDPVNRVLTVEVPGQAPVTEALRWVE